MKLSVYASKNISGLIDKVAGESARAVHDASEDSVHDLRVAIRRLSETLRVFEDVCPEGTAMKVRKELREAMQLAGAIRNHDIAEDLAKKAEIKLHDAFPQKRKDAVEELLAVLARWNAAQIFEAWRTELHA